MRIRNTPQHTCRLAAWLEARQLLIEIDTVVRVIADRYPAQIVAYRDAIRYRQPLTNINITGQQSLTASAVEQVAGYVMDIVVANQYLRGADAYPGSIGSPRSNRENLPVRGHLLVPR